MRKGTTATGVIPFHHPDVKSMVERSESHCTPLDATRLPSGSQILASPDRSTKLIDPLVLLVPMSLQSLPQTGLRRVAELDITSSITLLPVDP